MAGGAFVVSLNLGVVGASQRAVRQQSRIGQLAGWQFRDIYFGTLGCPDRLLESHLDIAQLQELAQADDAFVDLFAVDKSPVGGVQVPHQHVHIGEDHLAMAAGNRWVGYLQMVGQTPADPVQTWLETQDAALFNPVGDEKSGHRRAGLAQPKLALLILLFGRLVDPLRTLLDKVCHKIQVHHPDPQGHDLARSVSARLRLRVTATAESILRSGHPWLYADSIREQNHAGELGDLAVVYDRRDRFLAVGLFDPDSPLRVRVLHHGKPQSIDLAWWEANLRQAVARRANLFDARTTGYRWIHGESDGWPGLVLDRYDTTLVAKLYTAAWLPLWDMIAPLFHAILKPERLVLRLSRNIQELARERFQRLDGQVLWGPSIAEPVVFVETGLRFEADVLCGQKTGFFLDQRENRRRVESIVEGRRVLNVFSFAGGFSLYSARGGARSVTDVDISPHALQGADRNFALNRSDPGVRACQHETVQADAFEWLETSNTAEFDLIILDPPSLAKREAERARALQAYRRLISGAIRRLRPHGILVAASCSAHVSASEFFEAVRQTARTANRPFRELATTLHPPDHPATFPEAEYLKAIYLQYN